MPSSQPLTHNNRMRTATSSPRKPCTSYLQLKVNAPGPVARSHLVSTMRRPESAVACNKPHYCYRALGRTHPTATRKKVYDSFAPTRSAGGGAREPCGYCCRLQVGSCGGWDPVACSGPPIWRLWRCRSVTATRVYGFSSITRISRPSLMGWPVYGLWDFQWRRSGFIINAFSQ